MEDHKIPKSLNDLTVSKFVARKWIEVNDLSGGQYSVNNNIRFKTHTLRSDAKCDYSHACIVVKGRIILTGTNDDNRRNKKLTLKNNAPFRSCISNINNTFVENAEYIGINLPMHNLLE